MESKQLDIVCPCCGSRLAVDTRTGTILKSLRPARSDETGKPAVGDQDWDRALGKVRGREASGQSKLDDALARERDKSERMDQLFREASKKLRSEPDA
jgi:hypothetical protein